MSGREDSFSIFTEDEKLVRSGKHVRKKKLIIVLVLAVVLIAAAIVVLCRVTTSSEGKEEETVTVYKSTVDQDGDGVDDQTDILNSAKDYIAAKPKYKSKYYEGGYPNDGYGVCTDLVAAALKGAGYDLRALVDQDIRQNPGRYNVDVPDANIDYRRVPNLQVWFKYNTIACTLDLNNTEAWQGGDIVIFENHIGIISDKRNKKGIPYVIHHYSSHQTNYEEDILEKWGGIVGHYRMSEIVPVN